MAQMHPDTLWRQWQMLRMIPRHPHKITAKELRERLSEDQFIVSKRTIERDLLSLSALFPLVSDERERPYGWSWEKDAPAFDLPGLSRNEALMLAMVEQHLESLLPASTLRQLHPYFKAARQRIESVPLARSWLDKVRSISPTQPFVPPEIAIEVQESVHEALLSEKQLFIRYLKRGENEASEYRVHPLALVQRGPVAYLYCTLFDYADTRILAMHRIKSALMLDDTASIPEGFSIDSEIAKGRLGFGSGNMIRLEAIFHHGAGDHLFETPMSSDQHLEEFGDGEIRLVATVADTPQLTWWLLGFGDGVEVIEPIALRKSISDTISRMKDVYSKNNAT